MALKMKKIYGFYHIWLKNHYADIVKEQIDVIVNSGLYDAVEKIYCGVVGDYNELLNLNNILKEYPKFVVSEYSTNDNLYEFQTLNILKMKSDAATEDFYAFYIHVKGVSFPESENKIAFYGGEAWRHFMNEYTITQWKRNVDMLDRGHDTSGTQIRTAREWPFHYSGNMWWATSNYIRTLPPIGKEDLQNRMNAEFWIGRGHPVTATLSQQFVDYYHSPEIHDEYDIIRPDVQKGRTIVHTLAFNTPGQVEKATKLLYQLNDRKDFIHVIADCGFPSYDGVTVPEDYEIEKGKNSNALREIAKKYGSEYIKIQNIGVSQNWMQVWNAMNMTTEDVIIGCDPDERPQTKNWVRDIARVLMGDKTMAVASLIMKEQFAELNDKNSKKNVVNGVNVIEVDGGLMWSQIGISGNFIKKVGGIPFIQQYSRYGHLEGACLQLINKYGYKWCMVSDHISVHTDEVPLLREWKNYIIFRRDEQKEQVSMEQFLTMKKEGQI